MDDENSKNCLKNDLLFKNIVPLNSQDLLLHIYIIRALDLSPRDSSGTVHMHYVYILI